MNMKDGKKKRAYTAQHAQAGINIKLPDIEYWENQYKNYEITIVIPEFTSVCPKTKLPDFGIITLYYTPDKRCLELKSLKEYFLSYRNVGIFYENAVNKILKDVVRACSPERCVVRGEFNARGGMKTTVEAAYTKKKKNKIK